jgi:hypothetical protein
MRSSETLNTLHKGRGSGQNRDTVWAERSRDRAIMPLARSKKTEPTPRLGTAQSIATPLRLARVLMNGTVLGWYQVPPMFKRWSEADIAGPQTDRSN